MPTKTQEPTRTTPGSPLWSTPIRTADGRLLPSRGKHVCAWIERHLVYGEGDWYGQPVRLRPYQRRWIYRLFEYYPETGRRRYRRALRGMAKGNGKTPEAGWVGAHELLCTDCAPPSPRIIAAASSFEQADLVFGDLRTAVAKSPTLGPFVLPFEKEIQIRDRPGIAQRIAAEAGTNDGARATVFLADELHEWQDRRERVFMIVDGAIAKRRDAFSYVTSTAGWNRDHELYRLYALMKQLAEGQVTDDAFLGEWYEAPEDLDLEDENDWMVAIQAANPAAGDFVDIENLRHRFRTMPRFEFERYHLNRWTTAPNRWIPPEVWEACADLEHFGGPGELPADGERIVLGFDGSYSGDSTALVGATLEDHPHLFVVDCWEKAENDPEDWRVDIGDVEAAVQRACGRWRVQRMGSDPFRWQRSLEILREQFGKDVVIDWPTTSAVRMVAGCAQFYDAVAEGRLSQDGNADLARHLANAVIKVDGRGPRITKDHRGSANHIDLAVAAIIAYDLAVRAGGDSEPRIRFLGGEED